MLCLQEVPEVLFTVFVTHMTPFTLSNTVRNFSAVINCT